MSNARHEFDQDERRKQKTEHKGRSREEYRSASEARQSTPVQGPRQAGKIKTLVSQKGFGFIQSHEKEFFFHRSETPDFDALEVGQAVTFQPMTSPKGARAGAVQIDL